MLDTAYVKLTDLFFGFLRVGATAFGGPAMIPHVRKLVLKHQWITEEDFRTGIAICQMIPGATVMQLAAYVGVKTRGLLGAIVSFVGFGSPAFVMMLALSWLYFSNREVAWVVNLFSGLKIIVVAIVLHGAIDFIRRYTHSLPDLLIALFAAIAFSFHLSPPIVLVCAIAIGIIVFRKSAKGASHHTSGGVVRSRNARNFLGKILAPFVATSGCAAIITCLLKLRPSLAVLAMTMAKIDIIAFGGGFAALPVMLHVVVQKGWMDMETLLDGIALGQLTPGPIVITSVFVGFHRDGIWGAIVSAFGTFSPSFLILLWAMVLSDLWLHHWIAHAVFRASLATLSGLMTAMAAMLIVKTSWNLAGAVLALLAFMALQASVDVMWVILSGSALWALRIYLLG
jgi:chromate transporter